MTEKTPMSQLCLVHEAKSKSESSLITLGIIGVGLILVVFFLAFDTGGQIKMSLRLFSAAVMSIGFVLLFLNHWFDVKKLEKAASDTSDLYSKEALARSSDKFDRIMSDARRSTV